VFSLKPLGFIKARTHRVMSLLGGYPISPVLIMWSTFHGRLSYHHYCLHSQGELSSRWVSNLTCTHCVTYLPWKVILSPLLPILTGWCLFPVGIRSRPNSSCDLPYVEGYPYHHYCLYSPTGIYNNLYSWYRLPFRQGLLLLVLTMWSAFMAG